MAPLHHPSIVSLYQFREAAPLALVMEYVSGTTLAKIVETDGRLSLGRACRIVEEIASALDCVHSQGIIHRDIKPSNILVPPRGPAKLTDFGVAYVDEDAPLTVMGDILGTIEYASPEQVHGHESPDERTDVYSLAAVTYFALTGSPPFRAADNSTQARLSVMHRQVFSEPAPLRLHREDLPVEVERVVLRGLAKSPDDRFQSAGQMAAALRDAVEAAPEVLEERAAARSTRRGAIATAALIFLLLSTGLWRVWHRPEQVAVRPPVIPPVMPLPVTAPPIVKPKPVVPAVTLSHPHLPPVKPPVVVQPPMVINPPVVVKPPVVAPPVVLTPPIIVKRPAIIKPPSPVAAIRPQTVQTTKMVFKPPVKPHLPPPPQTGWLQVFARQNLAPIGGTEKMAAVPASLITVDGRPMPALSHGGWVSLPTGKHLLGFFPAPGTRFGPRIGVPVTVAAQAHLAKQILLPVQAAVLPPAPPSHSRLPSPPVAPPIPVKPQTEPQILIGPHIRSVPEGH